MVVVERAALTVWLTVPLLLAVVGIVAVGGGDGLIGAGREGRVVQVAMPEPLSAWVSQPEIPPPEKATVPVGLVPA